MDIEENKINENEDIAVSEEKAAVKKDEKWEWIRSILIAVVLAFIIKFFLFDFAVVDGSSMFPTLKDGERLLMNKIEYSVSSPDYGDIVIIKISQNVDYVKRVIGKAGDTIEIKDQVVYRNGEALKEDYINPEPYEDFEKVTVPQGQYFVMGDNRANSKDSRYIGCIEEDRMIGHVIFRIWPFSKMGTV